MKLTKLAKDRECTIRVPEFCNRNPETAAPAHYRLSGISGGSQKSPDLFIAFACSTCHDIVDGRLQTPYPREKVRLWHLEGVVRTQYQLVQEGYLKW